MRTLPLLLLLFLLLPLPAVLAGATAPVWGDLDGDGQVDADDETLLRDLFGAQTGDARYDAAADSDGDGVVDHRDLALFGDAWGSSGAPDGTPPALFVTLNDIEDDFNDLLVVPPEGFRITLALGSAGGSLLDPTSLSVVASHDIAGIPAGTELAGLFTVTPTAAVWELPPGSDLARTSHELSISVQDLAGNTAQASYGFAVRDFTLAPPLGSLQTVFLDLEQDRSLGPDVDFLEDLRSYGLSSPSAPAIEAQVRSLAVEAIRSRALELYGRLPDGSAGPDPVNVVFVTEPPAGPHARLCVGGQSPTAANVLGLMPLDPQNSNREEDTCSSSQYGVFPQAIDDIWDDETSYTWVFQGVDPDLGGVPIGEDPLDAAVLDPGFDPDQASSAALGRAVQIQTALEAFAQIVGTVVAHETGHLLGLVPHGPAPGGLWGGSSGARTDHNVALGGAQPAGNWVMNAGASFSFDSITGWSGMPTPLFRPMNQAYLRDRVVLAPNVTGLYPPPQLQAVVPSPAVIPAGQQAVGVTVQGALFLDDPVPPLVQVKSPASPTWKNLGQIVFVDDQTLTASVNRYVVLPGVYDVRLINADGQSVVVQDLLEVFHE
jgi:hypothetical protein